MPAVVLVLGLGVFCMNTAEVLVAGLVPQLASAFGVSLSAAGDLVSVYAAGVVFGGPVLTILLLGWERKRALLVAIGVFLVGQTLAAVAPSYPVMVLARLWTAVAASAFIGISAAVCVDRVGPARRGQALAVLFGGLMLAQVVALPGAAALGQQLGWRASFWVVDGLTVACGLAVTFLVPARERPARLHLADELRVFRRWRLWGVYATNALTIGAVYTVVSYFVPILTRLAGFPARAVPLLLVFYGIATLVGNLLTGRLADRHTCTVLTVGVAGIVLSLVGFAVAAGTGPRTLVLVALGILGLVGLPMNPAMATRVIRHAHEGPLVQTVNTAAINVGILTGPALGGLSIRAGAGLAGPLWAGAGLALLALATLLPGAPARGRSRDRSPETCP